MKKILSLSWAAAVVVATSVTSFAQVPQSFSLEEALKSANDDYANVKVLLEKESAKGAGFDVCSAHLLSLQLTYDEWFIKHYQSFADIRNSVLEIFETANQKLKNLQNMTVDTNPVRGQTTSTVTISLSSLLSYFKNLNERLATSTDSELQLLMSSQENPSLNPLKISHSQAINAMQIMTTNLNASLKESSATYEVGFVESKRHFSIEFQLAAEISGKVVKFNLPLLEGTQSDLVLTEAQLWNNLQLSQALVDGYPIDACARYRTFRNQFFPKECIGIKKVIFPGVSIGVPFATYSQVLQNTRFNKGFGWSEVPFSHKSVQTIISESGTIYALVDGENGIRAVYSLSPSAPSWELVSKGAIKSILVKGQDLYAVGSSGKIYKLSHATDYWRYFAGQGLVTQMGFDIKGNLHYLISDQNLGPALVGSESYSVSSAVKLISFVAFDSGRYYVINNKNEIRKNQQQNGNLDAQPLPAPPSPPVQITGISEAEVLVLSKDGNVYCYSDGFWVMVAESPEENAKIVSIFINQNHQIVGTDSQGRVFVFKEKK